MSLWSKVSRLLPKRGNKPIGHDLQGNAYFEHANPYGRPKRMVEYANEPAYRRGTAQLPAQWTAWMSFTRDTPPSLAELQRDADRLAKLRPLVEAIEKREREERILQGYLLPDGSEPSKEPDALMPVAPPYPLDAEPAEEFIAPPREKVDPTAANSADELRKLAEEDTKRRLKESGVAEGSGPVEGVEGVGRAFKPRRRGQSS